MSRLLELQRRTFLAALGLGIAAPLALRMSRLALAQSGPRPVRLLVLYVPHGCPAEHFDPVTSGGAFDLMANGVGGWSVFEPYRTSLNLVRGIGMADGASNHVAIRAALTGFNEGGSVDSIDYVIAKKLGVTPHVIGAIPYRKSEGWSVDSHLIRHGGAWVRPMENPVDAADELLKGLGSGQAGPDESLFEAEALALTAKQVERLSKSVTGLTSEENKLKIHLEALQGIKAGGDGAPTSCTIRPALPAVAAFGAGDPLDENLFAKILDAQLEVAANAMICGTGRVITLQCLWVNSNLRMDFPGGPNIPKEHHIALSHEGMPRPDYALAQQWIFGRLAEKLLKPLLTPDPADPTHSVLDNSIVYITTEVSDGTNHNSDAGETWVSGQPMYTYLPQMLIGGGGGYLKQGGQALKVDDNRPHTDVLATLADAMGATVTDIGGRAVSLIAGVKA